ncbi:MAG: hypothetical protein J6K26_09325, partial [Lachnospiraceae bacterium]|nr:hypothetical protein [Lachnospiraceae bacterium]
MAVELKQYDGQTVTAQDDAILNDQLYGLNGIISGCNMNFISVNVVNIEAGYGLIKGREFKVTESTINCMLPDADGVGIIKLRMDLMNSSRPAEIITEAVSGDVYPGLEQDEDCNYNNGVYEMELARYTATATAITEFTQTYEVLEKQAVVAIKNDIVKINEDIRSLNNNLKQTTIIPEEGIELSTIDEKLNYLIENGTGSGSIQYCETVVNQEYKTYTFDKEYKLVVAFVTNGGNANDTINISYTDIEPIQKVSDTYYGKCYIFKDVPVGASITIGTST